MENFTIYITFETGDVLQEHHNNATLAMALKRLTSGPAARLGLIKELKVVDHLDCTNFEWKEGRLLYPIPGVHM